MAGTQAHKRPISQPHEGSSATRLRNNRSNAQTTIVTTTTNYAQSQQQYGPSIDCGTSSGNGSTNAHAIGISTITTASPNPNRALLESQILHQQQQHHQQQQEQAQHVEIVLNDDNDDAEQIAAEKELEHSGKKVRHRHHKRPFYRRVINYLRTAWGGVNFSSSNGKFNLTLLFEIFFVSFFICLFKK